MDIKVTQFLRPDGRQRLLTLEIPDEYEEQYNAVCESGCTITCEQLSTGEAAQYISHEKGDFDIRVTECGEAADAALLEMMNSFNSSEFQKWLAEQE